MTCDDTQPAPAPLMLSVSGVRGIVGQSITPAVAREFAAAFGSHVRAFSGKDEPLLCLGRDSRPSGESLATAALHGLAAVGCRVIDLGVVMTPTVGVMIAKHHADAGIVITASHNPTPWNGLKCLSADGVAPPAHEAARIIRRFNDRDIAYAQTSRTPAPRRDRTGNELHVARVLAHVDRRPIRAAGFRVVLDSINGAGGTAGRMLLDELGCETAHINAEPTGVFAHAPEPIEENLRDLAAMTASAGAACGLAQDPDADRLAIIDETGRYIGEEYTLVLAAKRLLDLHGGGLIAANLSTSRMIDDLAARYDGAHVTRTPVGEANVVAAMKNPPPSRLPLVGGEGNGGVIWPQVCWVRDSLSAIALLLSLLAHDRRPLSAIVDELPRYCMIKHRVDLHALGGRQAVRQGIANVIAAFRDASHATVNTADGVRVDWTDGWVHLRPSNTEPIVRLIAEALTREQACELMARIASIAGLPRPPA